LVFDGASTSDTFHKVIRLYTARNFRSHEKDAASVYRKYCCSAFLKVNNK